MNQQPGEFVNAHNEVVPYDGSEVTWRVLVQLIVIRDGKILMIKDKRLDFWSTPGGAAEVNETLHEVAEREFTEETGGKVKVGKFLTMEEDWFCHVVSKTYHHSLMPFYLGEVLEEPSTPTDQNIVEWKWFSPEEIQPESTNATVYSVLKEHGYI